MWDPTVPSDIATISATLASLLVAVLAFVVSSLLDAHNVNRRLQTEMGTTVSKGELTLDGIVNFLGQISSIGRRIEALGFTLRASIVLTIFNILLSISAVWVNYGQLDLVNWLFAFFVIDLILVSTAVVILSVGGFE